MVAPFPINNGPAVKPCRRQPRLLAAPTRRARMAAEACSLGVTISRNLREDGLLGSNTRHLSAVITALPRKGWELQGVSCGAAVTPPLDLLLVQPAVLFHCSLHT